MNEERYNLFCETYKRNLTKARQQYPQHYNPHINQTIIETNMCNAFAAGTFNKDSKAIKWTCKELGIKHTYKAIKEFLNGENILFTV